MSISERQILAAVFAALLTAAAAFGQAGDAEITGIVKDATGAVVAGASVTVANQDSGVTHSTTTGPDGRYRVIALSPGSYSLRVSAPGFKTESITDLVLTVSTQLEHNVALTVGAIQDSVT